MSKTDKLIKIEQTGSPIRRQHTQRETLIGLGLNRIGRKTLLDGAPGRNGRSRLISHNIGDCDESKKAKPSAIAQHLL